MGAHLYLLHLSPVGANDSQSLFYYWGKDPPSPLYYCSARKGQDGATPLDFNLFLFILGALPPNPQYACGRLIGECQRARAWVIADGLPPSPSAPPPSRGVIGGQPPLVSLRSPQTPEFGSPRLTSDVIKGCGEKVSPPAEPRRGVA